MKISATLRSALAAGAATALLSFVSYGARADDASLAEAKSLVESHMQVPQFEPTMPAFDAVACTKDKKLLSIPVSSTIPFVQGVEEGLIETGKTLGHQLSHVGTARIDRLDDLSTATILDIKNAVHNGDRLLPVPEQEQQQALRAPIQTPRQKIRGYIAGLYEASYLGADCMIAIINRGKQHGIQPGYILGVYHEGRVLEDKFRFYHGRESKPSGVQLTQLPPEKVSNAIVYSVSDNLSYALIIDSAREVQNGDRIGNP